MEVGKMKKSKFELLLQVIKRKQKGPVDRQTEKEFNPAEFPLLGFMFATDPHQDFNDNHKE